MNVYEYRFRCVTEDANVTCWRSEEEGLPTTCPHDTSHEINPDSITIIETIASSDVNITGATLDVPVSITAASLTVPVQQKGAPDYSGYPYFIDSVYGTAVAGQTSNFYLSFDKNVKIQGGGFYVDNNVNIGDYIRVDMTYTEGGPVVGVLIEKMYLWPGRVFDSGILVDMKEIPVGIFLRVQYVSTGNQNINVIGWYHLRRVPNA